MSAPTSVPTTETRISYGTDPITKALTYETVEVPVEARPKPWEHVYTESGQFKAIRPGMGTVYPSGGNHFTGVANKCRSRGDSYLPASMAGQPVPDGAIGSVPTLGHRTVEVERKAPTRKTAPSRVTTLETKIGHVITPPPAPPIAQSVTQPTAIDWETQYHMAEANYILVKSENDRLRQRLTDLGFTVTGKPGLAQITR